MKIDFSPDKDKINIAKHKFSLGDAVNIEWDTLWAQEDERYDYGEIRMVGYAYIRLRLFCIVYTDCEDVRRIISLRKATKRELKRYAET